MSLDPTQDPDRFVPDAAPSPLDPTADPDRFQHPTLPGLLGEGSQEGERNNLTWLIGLVCVFGFLILVSLLLQL